MSTVLVTILNEHGESRVEEIRNAEVRVEWGCLKVIMVARGGGTKTRSWPFQWVMEWEVTP